MKVRELINALEQIAPLSLAAEWDNVGLLVGSDQWPVDSVLLTIDLTEEVLREAIEKQATLIVAYHPPIFDPLTTLTDRSPKQRIILEAIRAGISIYSPHTALDAAPGGVNDWLAEGLGPGVVHPLQIHAEVVPEQYCKIVTIGPAKAIDEVHRAMSDAGAGVIGDYEQCSFRIEGIGTFFGTDSAHPTTGEKGKLERVEEVRLEMVCSEAALEAVLTSLRKAHPYEEPPIEMYPLLPRPEKTIGQGRLVRLETPATMNELIERLKMHLGVEHLKIAIGQNTPATFQTIGLCAGAGGSMLDEALNADAEVFLTGEMSHHDTLKAIAKGCAIILAGHTNTERGYLSVLKRKLESELSEASIAIAERDRAPFQIV